jgi:hypothetical protein
MGTNRFTIRFPILRSSSTIHVLDGLAVSPDALDARAGKLVHRTDCVSAAE